MRLRVLPALTLALSACLFAQQPAPQSAPSTPPVNGSSTGPATGHHYTNSSGQHVHSPVSAPSAPVGASAKCRDSTYSFSQHRQGTCSHHGGVALWLIH